MEKKKSNNIPASLRIAFIVFLALGFIITGALWMKGNEMRRENDILEQQVTSQSEENARKEEQLNAPMDEDYVRDIAHEYGYVIPGEEFYPLDVEE